jgi:hypothetical protein
MSKFINKKEEVIQLGLTQLGKVLYSQGKFEPAYYAFYDDDILYDPDYFASGSTLVPDADRQPIASETQNQIVTRIKDTPRLGLQTVFFGFDRESELGLQSAKMDRELPANDKFFQTIGRSSPFTNYAPAWNIQTIANSALFTGSMTGSRFSASIDRSTGGPYNPSINPYTDTNLAIPQLTSSLELHYTSTPLEGVRDGEEHTWNFYELEDEDKLVIDVQEINTVLKSNGNFDVEVFRVLEPPPPQEGIPRLPPRLVKLGFKTSTENNVESDFLSQLRLGMGDQGVESQFPDLSDSYVEYFLSIKADDEIDDVDEIRSLGGNLYDGTTASTPDDPCD